MRWWGGAALLGASIVSAAARAEPPNQRLYDIAALGTVVPDLASAAKLPHLLATDNRWSLQRVRSKRLHFSTGIWAASAYFVGPRHDAGLAADQPVAGRTTATAAGADLTVDVAHGFALIARATAFEMRSRSYVGSLRSRGLKTDRLVIGTGVEIPGNSTLVVDYIRAGASHRSVDRLFGQPRGADQLGSGARLTLTGREGEAAGPVGWALTLGAMRRPEVRYGEAVSVRAPTDRRVELGMHIRL